MKNNFLAILSSAVLSAFILPSLATICFAQGYGDHWHGDINHFHGHDFDHWRGGNWFHGPHGGRDGWWWIVDGEWYFYPAPVYPYPDPYVPPTVVVQPGAAVPGAPQYLYYCSRPAGYYPYVSECLRPWQAVVAAPTAPAPTIVVQQPPVAAPPPAPVPMQQGLSQRDMDYQQLNGFAGELANTDVHAPHAASKLRTLQKHVEAFRQALFQRTYNAMDVLRSTEDLQHKISAKRTLALKGGAPTATIAPSVPSVSPSAAPPATTTLPPAAVPPPGQ